MRSLIKKILKEETQHDVRVGDIYKTGGVLILITELTCDDVEESKRYKETMRWGRVEYLHDGCYVRYKVSSDKGNTWYYEDGGDYSVEKNWINFIINKGYWQLVMKGGVDFFNLNESEENNWFEDVVDGLEIPDTIPEKITIKNGMRFCIPNEPLYRQPWYLTNIGGPVDVTVKKLEVKGGLVCYVYDFMGWQWVIG